MPNITQVYFQKIYYYIRAVLLKQTKQNIKPVNFLIFCVNTNSLFHNVLLDIIVIETLGEKQYCYHPLTPTYLSSNRDLLIFLHILHYL